MSYRLLLLLLLLPLAACNDVLSSRGVLKPFPTGTPSGASLPLQAATPSFAALNEEPERYEDRLIRVAGALHRLPPPACSPSRGPGTRWALVGDNLRLDGKGMASILMLAPRETVVTLDGVWRRYIGPLGCGKEPAVGQSWYLEALRIVAPNPLPGYGPLPEATAPGNDGLLGPPSELPTATAAGLQEQTGTPVPGASPAASETPTLTPAGTRGTPAPTPTASRTPTPTRPPTRTPAVSATPGPSPTPTPTAATGLTVTPAPTDPSGGFATATPGPPAPTFTPGTPYPAPTPLPTFPSPYP